MKIHFAAVLLLFIVMSSLGMAVSLKGGQPFIKTNTIGDFQKVCLDSLKRLPGNVSKTALDVACSQAKVLEGCYSVEGHPIYHFQPKSKQTANQNRILVIGVMHGDEAEGGKPIAVRAGQVLRVAVWFDRHHFRIEVTPPEDRMVMRA